MKILAVCLGNICRSPLAQGILENLCMQQGLDWYVDSAGTSDWHVGEAPCEGSIEVARKHGVKIDHYQGRQIRPADFETFDLILAMDSSNYQHLIKMAPNEEAKNKIKLILNYSYPGQNRSVPDSYYTGNYKEVFDLLNESCQKIVEHYK
jgi:protein-tyrosine phosphatase